MSLETDDIEIAKWLSNAKDSKENPAGDPGRTLTKYGIATSDSVDGKVSVDMEGTTVSGSGDQSVQMTATCSVKKGQRVILTLVNNDPIVTGVAGWGDAQQESIKKNAQAVADALATAVAAQTFIGTCSTDAATAAKTVTGITGFALASGACIAITFSAANTAASPTLNINATGAKSIMLNGAAYAYWVAGATVQFIYDGTSWQVCNVPLYGATATIGNPASKNIYIDSDSIDFRQVANVIGSLGVEPYDGTHNLLSLLCGANYDGVKVGGGAYAILDQRVADATYGRYGTLVRGAMHETGAPRLQLYAYRGVGTVEHPINKEAEIDVGIDAGGNSYIWVSADKVMGYPFGRVLTAVQPVVLYNGGAALTYDTPPAIPALSGARTLSETAANFHALKLFYITDDGWWGSVEVPFPNGKKVTLTTNAYNGASMYVKSKTVLISGTNIDAFRANSGWSTGIWGSAGGAGTGDYIGIVRVEGIR